MSVSRQAIAIAAAVAIVTNKNVYAAPSVNVGVQASFGAPPYLINLLETAAGENASSYFPLLDRIAQGYFDTPTTDRDLYEFFRTTLKQDGHLTKAEDLASFDFALAINSAAPRIEAHYQYYHAAVNPLLGEGEDTKECNAWVHAPFEGKRFCSPVLDDASAKIYGEADEELHDLPFDRVLGDGEATPSVLYADITSRGFRGFHQTLSQAAEQGKSSYRLRYRPSVNGQSKPLLVSGYGVELALKRTDYIVIDDRQDEGSEKATDSKAQAVLGGEADEVTDLRPLSASEVSRLGVKAASFVLASENPMDTLARLLQDFPKHSSAIAATNVSQDFLREHKENRQIMLQPGFNGLWINGAQVVNRDVDSYTILERLRHERKLIEGVKAAGLTSKQAIDLLANDAIMEAQVSGDVQRYDWRDETEGGHVIMWLNDIEKDKRYADWPDTLHAVLQRMYPGQLPSVRRNLYNLVIPVDFSAPADVSLIVETLRNLVQRKVPITIGLVPTRPSSNSVNQAKVVYHLIDSYGLGAALTYLEVSLAGEGRKFGEVQARYISKAIEDRALRKGFEALSVDKILTSEELEVRINAASSYLHRLGAASASPPVFANGVAISRASEEWLQSISAQFGQDLQFLQEGVYQRTIQDDATLADLWLASASLRRNPIIVPENEKSIGHVRLGDCLLLKALPGVPASTDTVESELVHLVVIADITSKQGLQQILEALLFKREHDNVQLAILHLPPSTAVRGLGSGLAKVKGEMLLQTLSSKYDESFRRKFPNRDDQSVDNAGFLERSSIFDAVVPHVLGSVESAKAHDAVQEYWDGFEDVIAATGVQYGQHAILLNGRLVGPLSKQVLVEVEDFETLLSYEKKRRLLPAAAAIKNLGLQDQAKDPFSFARLSNQIALSQVSDLPEGIFETASTVRIETFKNWKSEHTVFELGDIKTATIQITTTIDPASEQAQRWVPILKVLSELDGVFLRVFLNPRDLLQELPIKRFYRHVLQSKPSFDASGVLEGQKARFSGLPADALLNVGMDVPPSWLVAPSVSVHDLDNIKVSAVKSGNDIDATYALEHILIEGHSRETGGEHGNAGPAPRGAQLVLSTRSNPHMADTIIMANVGYFQFKANPGVYNLAMQRGRSEEIFDIVSTGALGYSPKTGDNGTEVALLSFRGVTLFPRVTRKPGKEGEDVLEAAPSALDSLADNADKLLAKAGLAGKGASKYLSQAAKFGSKFFPGGNKAAVAEVPNADINIFSVASGHLYERMLNIMMVSVMKHTNHTVKFWFIEQFLSPSFKTFLPSLAAEYGFQYEMVTYKWPHWLRGQKEKQREIWGYKILFLDVLFPLNLDKVIFVDADQIVRTDMYELIQHDLEGAPYGFTPMCDSRTEMEGFRFWKQGYWKNYLRGLPYHISALYVVDLQRFRQMAAGDRLRQQYHGLSADPNSLSNLDQDLPNHMQMSLPIHSLPQDWLWCETWCSDEALKTAKTIDLCNNPETKEPKLARARRQVPEWTIYDDEIAAVMKQRQRASGDARPIAGDAVDAGVQGEEEEVEESIQERLQREDAERERKSEGHQEL